MKLNARYNLESKIITSEKEINNILNIIDIVKIINDGDKKKYNIYEYDNNFRIIYCKVTEINDDFNFKIDLELNDEIRFIYGSRTNDFQILDNNRITPINTRAIKDLYDLIENQKQEIELLKEILTRKNIH